MNQNSSTLATWILMASMIGWTQAGTGAEPSIGDPRAVVVEELRNDHPAFLVRVDVDQADRIYHGGETMRVNVVSAQSGYLYLLYCDAAGKVTCLFPNAFGQANHIEAMQPIEVPQPTRGNGNFRLRIGPPYGQEVLKAIVSLEPMDTSALGRLILADGANARLSGMRAVYVEESTEPKSWAEHFVKIETRASEAEPQVTGDSPLVSLQPDLDDSNRSAKRVGVFIGISEFADERIRDLSVCHRDASRLAQTMRTHGQIGQGWILLNENATRRNIEQTIRSKVAAATRPGDSVIIYWSGHGSRCADDGGDEQDGFDEYLVPHDGNLDNLRSIRSTMVMDDTFGRWIQELDGRRVLIVLDTCHSGGQSTGQKSISSDHRDGKMSASFDFLDGEMSRIKDIGQRDTALLASSTASQVSFERQEGDLSTMTYFLIQQLEQPAGTVTLQTAYKQLRGAVTEYVQSHFPGTTQTPVLVDNLSAPFLLVP
jgi:hypothetical protein